MRASEILRLAVDAGVSPGASVLDLCCGVAGPGRFLTSTLGCNYLGVDASASAVDIARERAAGLACRFLVGRVPPVPCGPFDVVLMLETFLAFPDKEVLLRDICAQLPVGGRFAFSVEAGDPLSGMESSAMPDADTVWLTPVPELTACLKRVGLQARRWDDVSQAHLEVVESLLAAFGAHRSEIAARLGQPTLDRLLTSHRLWADWLGSGRVRKLTCVTERTRTPV
jgi:SAM-dependent methyltransferase